MRQNRSIVVITTMAIFKRYHKKTPTTLQSGQKRSKENDFPANNGDYIKYGPAMEIIVVCNPMRRFEVVSRRKLLWIRLVRAFTLFILMLELSPRTMILVNGIRLLPKGKEKFYWSGEQSVVTCENNNNLQNVETVWFGPCGVRITGDREERIHVESNGERLVVDNPQPVSDDGFYTCMITDGQQTRESTNFTLKVLKNINFKTTTKHETFRAGSRGQIDCYVDFDQSVTSASVTWLKNKQLVDLLNDSSIMVQEYDPGRQVSSLIFVPVKREHDDEYTCQATAVTPNLSKIIDHKIRVETQFGPTFDSAEEIIWVESIQAINSRLHNSGEGGQHTTTEATSSQHQYQQQQQQSAAAMPHGNMVGANTQHPIGGRLSNISSGEEDLDTGEPSMMTGHLGQWAARVELKCSCQANPDANIRWFASSNPNSTINKGSPEQVVEMPIQVRSGHNVTSTLVIAYNLDKNWEHRREKYKCSASNLFATAEKFYTIEQGHLPPAFLVGPDRSYNPETSVLNFTLLGPAANFLGGAGESVEVAIGDLSSIMPRVDSFRIRAESLPDANAIILSPMDDDGGYQHQGHLTEEQAAERRSIGHTRQQTNHTVLLACPLNADVKLPLNLSVKLDKHLPGVQRLFLEAHNAVGYSSNSTYLGEFNLVSSADTAPATPPNKFHGKNFFILLVSLMVIFVWLVSANYPWRLYYSLTSICV